MKPILGSLALIGIWSMDASAAQTQESPAPGVYVPARQIKAAPFVFQGSERNRDTYLQIEMTISEAGQVTAAEPAEGAFADPGLIKRALSASRKQGYEPATEDGKPVVSRVEVVYFHKQPFDQAFGSSFGNNLDELVAAFNSGDVDKGRSIAKKMLSRVVKTRYEYVALQGAVGKGELKNGNALQAIRALRAATAAAQLPLRLAAPNAFPFSGIVELQVLAREKVYLAELLEVLMRVTALQGFLSESRQTYYQLAELVDMQSADPRSEVRRTVEAKLRSREPVQSRIVLDEVGTWKHYLSRQRFSVQQVEGSAAAVELDCGKGLRILALPIDEAVAPETDVSCRLRIKGAAGDTLTVTELW
jgi:hypothetical protein